MLKPIKSLGQNFLKDPTLVSKVISYLDLHDHETVIEIGPGLGVFTKELAKHNVNVIAVEVDIRLVQELEKDFSENSRVEIVNENILHFLPAYVLDGFKVFGSLPYNIASPVLHAVVKMEVRPENCVFIIQKEVAQKVVSKSPDNNYLSVFVQTFFEAMYLGSIPREKFRPVPKVDGGIIRLRRKETDLSLEKTEQYEKFLHKGFKFPRKMINKVFSKEELKLCGVSPNLRAENLSVEKWLEMFGVLESR
jgi:16S rRNA (adenine1518-N6/adenine1519-N6)-dimethyltransferase